MSAGPAVAPRPLLALALSDPAERPADVSIFYPPSPPLADSPAGDLQHPWTGRGENSGEDAERLKSYAVEEELGSGSDAVVRRAVQKSTGRTVAIKSMPKKGRSSRSLARFRLEGKLLTEVIVRHPNVVGALEWIDAPDAVHVVLEYAAGGTM